MQLGVVGLGRMGRIVAEQLVADGHEVIAFDRDETAREAAEASDIQTVSSLDGLLEALTVPRRLWLMVPAGDPVDAVLAAIGEQLRAEAIVIDGGNSHFEASRDRAAALEAAYLDCGTSGGPGSAQAGFSLMVGGPAWAYEAVEPALIAVATGPDGVARMGPSGAGHYVKMVHNGIEYALMQAYGEGFELLAEGRYELDLETVAHTWNHGAVIRSWLLELCEEAFIADGNDLDGVADHVGGGSTGSWTVAEAIEHEVPIPLIYTALAERFDSRTDRRFSRQLANHLRSGFGHHPIARTDEQD